ncbi:OmpH family outer membrane protein [Fulvivirga lutea]|uniref:OmpH family outer membrane protein n=1 Tax=Fulvivirga lutea TaxID=2810512 RepID=A0A974WFS6_9BACT|nr:OmpH family outer membrane protein [Fulvivirga lutea]QSE96728.1 OmpH family outer membrane protein [Fulvivirga lutea]
MKNLSLVLNIVLVVAVGVLYVLHFSKPSAEAAKGNSQKNDSIDYSVVYINSDSVLVNYDYFDKIQSELQEKGAKLEKEYQSRAEGLQREVNDFQRTVNSLTIGQAKALEEDLLKKQQNLRVYQENLSQQLMREEAKMNQELYKKVTSFLKDYSAENGIDLVVKFNQGSDVLYANEGMDITKEVIEGLNAAYAKELSAPKAKTDSTKAE